MTQTRRIGPQTGLHHEIAVSKWLYLAPPGTATSIQQFHFIGLRPLGRQSCKKYEGERALPQLIPKILEKDGLQITFCSTRKKRNDYLSLVFGFTCLLHCSPGRCPTADTN